MGKICWKRNRRAKRSECERILWDNCINLYKNTIKREILSNIEITAISLNLTYVQLNKYIS